MPLVNTPTHLDRLSVGPYGTPDIDGSLLQLTSDVNNLGALMLPRMSATEATTFTTQASLNVAKKGFLIYVNNVVPPSGVFTTEGVYYYDGAVWQKLGAAGPAGLPFPGVIVTDGAGVASAISTLIDTTGSTNNLSLGNTALPVGATGTNNVALGLSALASDTTGSSNVGIGTFALNDNTTGSINVAVGAASLTNNTTGSGNTGVGNTTLTTNTIGTNNVAVGGSAGDSFDNINNGTFLGATADATANGLTNVTALGFGAQVTTSNTVVLGNTSASVAIGTPSALPSALLTMTSTTKGMRPPAMTTVQKNAIASPAEGLIVYDTDLDAPYYYDTTSATWKAMSGGSGPLPFPGVIVTDGAGVASAISQLFDDGSTLALGLDSGNGGSSCVAVGNFALQNNTASFNTALGYGSLGVNTTGQFNTALGGIALPANTTGQFNTAVGNSALAQSTFPSGNTAVGAGALGPNIGGGGNTALGRSAGALGNTLNNCTFLGNLAQPLVDGLTNAISIGSSAVVGTSNTMVLGGTGVNAVSVVVGATGADPSAVMSLNSNTQGFLEPRMTTAEKNAIVAPAEGLMVYDIDLDAPYYYDTTSATWKSMAGSGPLPFPGVVVTDALGVATAVSRLTDAGGALALGLNSGNGTIESTAIGNNVLQNDIGGSNTGVGYNALNANLGGVFNVAVGDHVLELNTTGDFNTSVGSRSLVTNSTGSSNTAVGNLALTSNVSGTFNCAFGTNALINNSIGDSNIGVGASSLSANNSGSSNVGVGIQTLAFNTTGSQNTAVGSTAGTSQPTNSSCTFLGNAADAAVDALVFSTAIGANALVGTSNTMVLGGLFASGSEVAVCIGSGTKTTSAMLSLTSLTEGFLPPAMTTGDKNAIVTPADGLQVYDTSLEQPFYYNGTTASWVSMAAGAGIEHGVAGPLVAGTLVVASATVNAGSTILLTNTAFGGIVGVLAVTARTVGVDFTVTSSSPTDLSSFNWAVIN